MNHSEQEVSHSDSCSENQGRPQRIHESLRLVHHHPGYLRIQADAFIQPADDDPVVTAVQTAVEVIPGFRSWSHNPKTGSAVIEYDPGVVDADDLLKHIAKQAGFRSVENSTNHQRNREQLVDVFLDAVQDVNQIASQMTGGRADLRELAPVALAATAVVSFVLNDDRGRLPDWNSALYHSYRVFMQWHRKEVRTRERSGRESEENSSGKGSGDGP